jgi:translation initiation factor 2-alpha kinase 4
MAWQTSRGWKTPLNNPVRNEDTSFPGLAPTSPDGTQKIEHEEVQQNELLALEAIYGEDFVVHGGTHTAWKVRVEIFFVEGGCS